MITGVVCEFKLWISCPKCGYEASIYTHTGDVHFNCGKCGAYGVTRREANNPLHENGFYVIRAAADAAQGDRTR